MKLIQSHLYVMKKIGELNKVISKICLMYHIDIYSSFENNSDLFVSYMMRIVEVYGITIYIHEHNSNNIYQNDDEFPIIHLIRIKLNDGSILFLLTEQEHNLVQINTDPALFIAKKPHVMNIQTKYIFVLYFLYDLVCRGT